MESKTKKILIITYYWPPAGGPGVQRWLKFVKYLPSFGWEPIVYIPENPSYPTIDTSLSKEIPENIKVIKTKIWEPYSWAEKLNKTNKKFKTGQFDIKKNQSLKSRISIWIRGNFFIPDARKFWIKPSTRFLEKYLQENSIDTIVTSGPPHSLHLIGLALKKRIPNLQWIADFRDPWTEISYYKHLKLTSFADKRHRKMEQSIFDNADITLATSYTDSENFKKKGANAFCITNGYDKDDSYKPQNSLNRKFTLSYIGILEQLRNPSILWECLSELYSSDANFAKDFELKFVGKIDDIILKEIENLSFAKSVSNLGYLAHKRAIDEMSTSTILLITNFPEQKSKGIIPGKIFEYLSSGNTILSFGPDGADVDKILNETDAGKHFTYQQKNEVKDFIYNQYTIWKNGSSNSKSRRIENFSRKELTYQLTKILENNLNFNKF